MKKKKIIQKVMKINMEKRRKKKKVDFIDGSNDN